MIDHCVVNKKASQNLTGFFYGRNRLLDQTSHIQFIGMGMEHENYLLRMGSLNDPDPIFTPRVGGAISIIWRSATIHPFTLSHFRNNTHLISCF